MCSRLSLHCVEARWRDFNGTVELMEVLLSTGTMRPWLLLTLLCQDALVVRDSDEAATRGLGMPRSDAPQCLLCLPSCKIACRYCFCEHRERQTAINEDFGFSSWENALECFASLRRKDYLFEHKFHRCWLKPDSMSCWSSHECSHTKAAATNACVAWHISQVSSF